MKNFFSFKFLLTITTLLLFTSCKQMIEEIKQKGEKVERYEMAALMLARDNRKLVIENGELKYRIQNLEARVDFLELELEKNTHNKQYKRLKNRKLKSSKSMSRPSSINFDIYNWTADQLLAVAKHSFNEENYSKAAEYFNILIQKYPKHESIDDTLLFKSGMSAYKSDKYYDWAINNFSDLINFYPSSQYYRGAKLWMGLASHKMGNKELFKKTIEEFRRKYRNTPEWKILSQYYEKFKEQL